MESYTEENQIHSDIGCSNVLSKFSCSSVLVKNAKNDKDVGLFATFSGQGVDSYFDELNAMFTLHNSKISNLVNSADEMFRRQLDTPEARKIGIHKQGLHILDWLTGARPTKDYLIQCAISYPLILLVQLCHYIVTAKLLFPDSKDPIAEMKKLWKGTTGHSQGIVASVIISISETEEAFIVNSCKMLKYLFWQGLRLQDNFNEIQSALTQFIPEPNSEIESQLIGKPTPLLAILGLPYEVVKKQVDKVNQLFESSSLFKPNIEISLINGPRAIVCSGSPSILPVFVKSLQSIQAKPDEDQSRIPFSKRKQHFRMVFLHVSVPFHSTTFCNRALASIYSDIQAHDIRFESKQLTVPVYSTLDGSDLRSSPDLMKEIVELQCVKLVNWEKALSMASKDHGISHIIDYGPGGLVGAVSLTGRLKEGRGVAVIAIGSPIGDTRVMSEDALFSSEMKVAQNWKEYAPTLVKNSSGKFMLNTKFSRLTGKPPIMVAGMTPTTANEELVAAFTNSGYHGELAGGGQATEKIFKDRIDSLVNMLEPGQGIHLNVLFLNPKLWNMQFPLSLQMRSQGIPIDSLTIAAGVPSLDKANEILAGIRAAGMTYIAFKPGSVGAIRSVLQIAENNPDITIVIQWTGGRAGGHHSFEDQYEPILETYAAIRRLSNTVLIAGGGLGDPEEATELLTGAWSEIHGYPPMPFDGLLLGSRVMVAKEAKTSLEVKKLIVDTQGVSHHEWEKSYEDDAGGVITVISELGEPIHKIATRGVLAWRDFDRKFFGLPAAQQEKAILSQKNYIIKKLNDDFQKVYFGKKLDGSIADIDHMTYFEVVHRMAEIMFVKQWVHGSYKERFVIFLQRTEERLSNKEAESVVHGNEQLIQTDPMQFLRIFSETYPASKEQLLTAEDVDYFLYLCRERGKPVNFVPIIDKDLQFWFKKDSLWQSEHLEFVQDQDVGRVCILQGPVAVKYSTKVNEPVGDILENLNQDILKRLSSNATASEVEYLAPTSDVTVTNVSMDTQVTDGKKQITYTLGTELPQENSWYEFLAGKNVSWWRALLTSSQFSDGKFRVPNGVKSLFKPRPGHKYVLQYSQDVPSLVKLLNSAGQIVAQVAYENSKKITVTIWHTIKDQQVPLQLEYEFQPEKGNQALVRALNNNNAIKTFYTKLWFSTPIDISSFNLNSQFESTKTITKEEIELFSNSIVGSKPTFNIRTGKLVAPIDYTIVACWESMMKPLFPWTLDANLMSLLHLSYSYKIVHPNPNFLLCEGETITSNVTIKEIVNMPTGKRVTVSGILKHLGVDAIEVTSQFFFPGNFQDFSTTFQRKEVTRVIYVEDKKIKAVLTSKPWIQWSSEPQLGDKLLLKIQTYHEFKNDKVLKKLSITGQISVYRGTMLEPMGTIQFQDEDQLYTHDPIEAFLERHGKPADEVTIYDNGGNAIDVPDDEPIYAPTENVTYSIASGDYNPIHSNIYIADLAGLPATITHGMWSAALARNLLDKVVTKKPYSYKVKNFQATFMEKVKPNDALFARMVHVGMKNGLKIIQVEILNELEIVVLKALAEVEQPKPAYVFTGQGSAEVGMGMDLYKQSPVAKEIWDKAEKHMLENYGFSLMTIVNKNPKELTVGFGGPRGSSIREKYMRLKHDLNVQENGVTVKKIVPLFPEISENTDFYTFRHPQGLLYATQFTQPALTLLEKASFADMKSKGLVPSDRFFAGHSLGEYAALASVANVLSVESLVELVFIRGITMQNAVPRDDQGRSCFSMVAVNPQRVGVFFSSGDLASLCNVISQKSGKLLQIVNYNVDNWQYIVTGHNANLEALRVVLTTLKENPTKKQELDRVIEQAMSQFPASSPLYTISQGPATMPLTGVDVPFHSDMLLGEVPRFREYLVKTLDHKTLDIELLQNKYIPNLTAIPFQASLDYADIICQSMENSVLPGILANKKFNMEIQDERQQLAYWILVELLAFQFASPVRWIETQDYFFKNGVEMIVEIGPVATLKGMAARTLQLNTKKYNSLVPRQLLSFKSDRDIIYYEPEPGNDQKLRVPKWLLQKRVQEVQAPVEVAAPVPASPTPVKVAPPTPVAAAAPSKPVGDRPVSAFETLQVLLALKLKKTISEISAESTIKDLVGGKSAIQNEILGDLQKEFGTEPDSAATTPLSQLAQVMGASYTKLGSQSQKLVSRVVSSKMPAGFGLSEIQDHLHKDRELGPGLIESVMLHSVLMEPEARLESITKSREWLDGVADAYASARGVSIGFRSNASGAVNVTVNAVDSEVLKAYERKHEEMYKDNMNLLAGFLGVDLRSGDRQAESAAQLRQTVEKELDVWEKEHGKTYGDGIKPMFDSNKVRKYNSSWNWARQEAFSLFYDTLAENPAQFDSHYCRRVFSLTNRATPELVDLVMEIAKKAYREGNSRVGKHVENLGNQIKNHLDAPPVFRIMSSVHDMPTIEVKNDGKIMYREAPRAGVKTFEDFVKEMRKGFLSNKSHKKKRNPLFQKKNNRSLNLKRLPYLSLRNGKPEDVTDYDPAVTNLYYSSLAKLAPEGLSFQHKTVLVTGAGRGSIGVEILKGLLAGGANVVVTTSRYGYATTEMYKKLYEEWGSKDSQLVVLPFNQGSQSDVNALIEYIYDENGLGSDIDFVLPFAAISEAGRDVSNLDSLSELSHRVMLTNVLRMIGKIKTVKQAKGIDTNPACVILPLSPNHGVFGGDGLYAESKLGLETIFNKWESESWQNYISIIGAVIGWTRGTGLMEGNNMVAHGVEQLGMRTFSQTEMAYAILGLLSAEIVTASQQKPLWADLTGGMLVFENLKTVVSELRSQISEKSEIFRSISKDSSLDEACKVSTAHTSNKPSLSPRSNIDLRFPELPTNSKLSDLRHLQGMVDLDKTVVIIGMGEVGPWGNQRTRWDIESKGELSIEGCVELAWIMGLVKYHNGPLKDGTKYVGWVDAKTLSPIKDIDIKMIYEDTILQHSGIRVIEPELFDGYNPNKKQFLHEVALHHDLDPFEVVTQEDANQFKLEHGDKVDIYEQNGKWMVQFKRGASMFLPRALKFDRFVAGQVPTGWDPARYGIPADIINQVDKITLYNLVSTVEAFVSAGIIDPYEFYEYVHVSEVGNTAGGGIGGLNAIRKTYRDRFMEQPVQADILQEVFINVMPAWVNLLLLSSSGPIKTPVGACATAAESVEIGADCILTGKAQIVVVGGYDDFGEESSYEFAQMKATSNSETEIKMGRTPREMSRPVSDTRAGFMESQGAGTQVLCSATMAIRMGVPIYGIVALTNTASDKVGRSVPAPGRGLLTTARESRSSSPLLDIKYRKRQLEAEMENIKRWKEIETQSLKGEYAEYIEEQAKRKEKAALALWGNNFYHGNDGIAPLRGALSVWGLSMDDLGVASFHGTGTKANDFNESQVTQLQLEHLGRTQGNPIFTIFQKYLTGHPKGAAAAWMANGLVQSLLTGIIPGNKNADNVDAKLKSFDHLVYTSKPIKTTGLKAGLLKSFGFGQASAEVVIIHPDYIFAVLPEADFARYKKMRKCREEKMYRFQLDVFAGKKKFVNVKENPPYDPMDEADVYLDPKARAKFDPKINSWKFEVNKKLSKKEEKIATSVSVVDSPVMKPKYECPAPKVNAAKSLEITMLEMSQGLRQSSEKGGVGIDVQLISEINSDDADFVARNFTDSEIEYCKSAGSKDAVKNRFAGRWAAKEAVIKAISNCVKEGEKTAPVWKGGAAALKGIEILPTGHGPASVKLYEHAADMARVLGINQVKVTISHSGEYAVAHAMAQ